jgi:YidC/Oxa1 family membrane protein insertase
MFDFIARPLAQLLNVFYTAIPNYAIAIILLTIVIMIVLTPLTIKQQRSMTAMQELQPEIKRIQAKHKGDRQKANEEVIALYQERGVNPLAGCLPLLIQMPFLFAMFQVLRGLTRIGPDGTFDPKYVHPGQALYDALHGETEMLAFGIDLSRSASQALQESGFLATLPYLVLVALSALFAWYNQRQLQRRRDASGHVTQLPGSQQAIMKVLPYLGPVFAFFFPAALGIYWVTQSLWRIGQQAYINRTIPPAKVPAEAADDRGGDEPPTAKGSRGGRSGSGAESTTPSDDKATDAGQDNGKGKNGAAPRRQAPGRSTRNNRSDGAAGPTSRKATSRRPPPETERGPRPSRRTGGNQPRRKKR